MGILLVILLSALLQVAAAWVALRTLRTTGRMAAWGLVTAALGLMAFRRLYVLVGSLRTGLPDWVLPNELVGLAISALMLAGVVLIRQAFTTLVAQRAEAADAGLRARLDAERLAAVMEAAPLPVWIAEDPDCHTIHGNRAADLLLRTPRGANHSASDPGGPETAHFRLRSGGRDLAAEEMPMQQAVRTGTPVRDMPMDLVFADGTTRSLLGNATPLRNDQGQVIGGVASFADLTEVRQAEERLRQVQKAESLGLMAGGIAHDFNNLFQAMVANLELVRLRLDPGSSALAYLDRLQDSLDRAAGLSREILHYSGGDLRRPEPLDLSAVVAEVAAGHAGSLEPDLAPGLPLVVADARLLAQVADGLILNAVEASGPGGKVQVRTLARQLDPEDLLTGFWPEPPTLGPCVVLEVEDRGHGIAPDTLPKIFDPYFSTRTVGRGLGLAAALGIVRSHGGAIQVESRPGEGSCFRVHLPSRASAPAPSRTSGPAEHGRRILLADDEGDLRESLSEMLRDWFGFEVVEARDGEEALACFRRQPEAFDLVLMDATMPRLGGVEAFRAMKALRPDLLGVLASGYADAGARDQAQAQGFADFLRKPFSSAELQAVLARVLDPA